MKILVTGDQGFIAKNLISKLDKNWTIYGIDVNDFMVVDDWQSQLIDIVASLSPDVIFHVGACSDTLEQNVNYMMNLNYEATKILSEYCYMANCKMIYSSSAANYGTNGRNPSNLYGWSKYAAEGIVKAMGGIALRYFNVYGPGEEHKDKMASVAYQSWLKIQAEKKVILFPKKPTRDFVYVDDIVSANLHALDNYEQFSGNHFDVGSGESRSFEEVMQLMQIPYDYTEESIIPSGYQFFTISNKNEWLPGWAPLWTIDTGVPAYLEYLKKSKEDSYRVWKGDSQK